jgi:hypothetical protein
VYIIACYSSLNTTTFCLFLYVRFVLNPTKYILPYTTLINLDYDLPLGNDLMRSSAYRDYVGRFSVSSLYLVKVGRIADIHSRTRVYNLSVK